jgi:predicted Zn finger-like uncharacterized protein
MANSLITRCPKCSTAFRVSDEVLSMAKGKVRCGQCFHIFDASSSKAEKAEAPAKKVDIQIPKADILTVNTKIDETKDTQALSSAQDAITEDDILNLFDENDLNPPSKSDLSESKKIPKEKNEPSKTPSSANKKQEPSKQYQERAKSARNRVDNNLSAERSNDLAPWEVELAEVEAALSALPPTPKAKATKAKEPVEANNAQTRPSAPSLENKSVAKKEADNEPDYMVALQSLAQTASEQTRPSDIKSQHTILEQLSAQESLAPLLEENEPSSKSKNKHPWLWFLASLLGLALLAGQVAMHYFEEGSRSSNFRSIYQIMCSYTGCALPGFEDVSAISIQHVRIQSHPSIPNTLLVNAIITNVSSFSQPMPKIALEFSDLNGSPVAARLFSPNDYLHKDFLDITYMPPNTPIHLVIPIQDPGARAVTHQLKAFPSSTRSY